MSDIGWTLGVRLPKGLKQSVFFQWHTLLYISTWLHSSNSSHICYFSRFTVGRCGTRRGVWCVWGAENKTEQNIQNCKKGSGIDQGQPQNSSWSCDVFSLFLKDTSAGWIFAGNGVLNLRLPVKGRFCLLTVPPCSPPTQHGQSGRGWTGTQSGWVWTKLSWSDLKRAEQSKKSKTEAIRGEERIAGQSGETQLGAPCLSAQQSCCC